MLKKKVLFFNDWEPLSVAFSLRLLSVYGGPDILQMTYSAKASTLIMQMVKFGQIYSHIVSYTHKTTLI